MTLFHPTEADLQAVIADLKKLPDNLKVIFGVCTLMEAASDYIWKRYEGVREEGDDVTLADGEEIVRRIRSEVPHSCSACEPSP